jgi:hypothetical protein
MKVCQIATVGENIEWILKGLLLFETNKLVLISTNEPEFVNKIKNIRERLSDPKFEINPIVIEEFLINNGDPIEFLRVFKKSILDNFKDGFQIEINATAGLRVWQLLGYFAKIQLSNFIRKYFIIHKQSGEPVIFPPEILSKTEQIILDIIGNNDGKIEDIKEVYEKIKGKEVSKGLMSKYLTKLKEKNLITEMIKNKFKYFELTDVGTFYKNPIDFYEIIN